MRAPRYPGSYIQSTRCRVRMSSVIGTKLLLGRLAKIGRSGCIPKQFQSESRISAGTGIADFSFLTENASSPIKGDRRLLHILLRGYLCARFVPVPFVLSFLPVKL